MVRCLGVLPVKMQVRIRIKNAKNQTCYKLCNCSLCELLNFVCFSKQEEYLANPTFDEDLFASAKCTSLFEVVRGEKCATDVVKQSLLYHLQRVEPHYLRSVT